MDYQEREIQKQRAWGVIHNKESDMSDKCYALLEVIETHYWRAKQDFDAWRVPLKRKFYGDRYEKGCTINIHDYTKQLTLWVAMTLRSGLND